jgi:hypothetical protein
MLPTASLLSIARLLFQEKLEPGKHWALLAVMYIQVVTEMGR